MTIHFNNGLCGSACGRRVLKSTTIKSKVTCIACRRTVAYFKKP